MLHFFFMVSDGNSEVGLVPQGQDLILSSYFLWFLPPTVCTRFKGEVVYCTQEQKNELAFDLQY